MASAAVELPTKKRTVQAQKAVNFSLERVKAPFILRCAAFCIDYMLLIFVPIAWMLVTRFLGEPNTTGALGTPVWVIGSILFVIDFLVLPMIRGKSLGKMFTGLTILKTDGSPVDVQTILKRNFLGYLLTLVTLGIGFLIAAFNTSGRALHDLIGGTVVVRGRKTVV